jgi:hypothetical protein
MTTRLRIVRALQRGPLYEGALRLVLNRPPDFDRALRTLQANGAIVRDLPDNPQTWKVAP